jgi:Na+-driven multidrug efflux pump
MEVGDVLDEMKRQLKLGLPISFTYVLNLSLVFVALMFVGHLSDSQHVFAGTALATSFSFVTGFSIMVRICISPLQHDVLLRSVTRTMFMASLLIDS